MALLGKAAVVIWVDIEPGLLPEHDHWHSTEHLPERMSVPGFLRGRRYAALDPSKAPPRFVLYELDDIAVTTSARYLARLNDPTPWSKRVMSNCRISRTLAQVTATLGEGVGGCMLTVRLSPRPGCEADLRALIEASLPEVAKRPGLVGAHWLQRDPSTVRPPTHEEKLRKGGADNAADWVILVEGFEPGILAEAADGWLPRLHRDAAQGVTASFYAVSHLMISSHG